MKLGRKDPGWLPAGGHWVEGDKEYVTACPCCLRPGKFYWNPWKQKGKCFSVTCAVSVRGVDFYRKLFQDHKGTSKVSVIRRDLMPVSAAPLLSEDDPKVGTVDTEDPWYWPASRSFLCDPPPPDGHGRGLTRETVAASGLRSDGRMLWVDLDPVCRGYKPFRYHRRADGSTPWMPHKAGVRRQAYVYALRHWKAAGRPKQIVLFEGIFDVLGPQMLGHGLAIMGASVSDDLALYLSENGCSVWYWPDPDAAGEIGLKKAENKLAGWGVPCVGIPTQGDPLMNPKLVAPARMREILKNHGWEGI